MKKLLTVLMLVVLFYISRAQEVRSVCMQINELNTDVLNGSIKKTEAAKQFKLLIAKLRADRPMLMGYYWVFPLKGYNYHAIGGINGNGYSDKGYNYLDGNKHTAHPAHDIFIKDNDQDGVDDVSGKPVDVLAVDDGIVIACTNEWVPGSTLRGGKFIWIYHHQLDVLTYYAHNRDVFVKPGDEVKQGQKIAEVGRTGFSAFKKRSPTHLHFSAFELSSNLPMPFNPYKHLKQARSK